MIGRARRNFFPTEQFSILSKRLLNERRRKMFISHEIFPFIRSFMFESRFSHKLSENNYHGY